MPSSVPRMTPKNTQITVIFMVMKAPSTNSGQYSMITVGVKSAHEEFPKEN
ncbi:MAG: hypothetical protein ACFWTZ_07250 [Burkholderia sp.]